MIAHALILQLSLLLLLHICGAFTQFKLPRITGMGKLMMVNQIDISMPALSSTMKEGKIVSWSKSVGDKVNAGDVLLVVESDKADMDVEAFEEGFLAAIYTPEGGSAPVGAVVAALVENKDDISKIGSAPLVGSSTPAAAIMTDTVVAPSGEAPQFEQILMPALSSTMKEGKIVSWSKKVGDKISSGDMVLVVESDKADMDVESYEEGYLALIAVGDGEVAPVGSPVGYLAPTADDIPKIQAFVAAGGSVATAITSSTTTTKVSPTAAASSTASAPAASATIINDGRVAASGYAKTVAQQKNIDLRTVTPSRPDQYITSKDLDSVSAGPSTHKPAPGVVNASPMARKLATENNIDVSKITGSGNFGRVMPDDVLKAAGKYVEPVKPITAPIAAATPTATSAATAAPSAPSADVPMLDGVVAMNGMQKAVAKNMEATLSVPIFRVSREIVTDAFDELYAKLKPKGVTVSAMLAKAVAEVLKKHPIVNAAYVEGGIKYNKDINVAMAVAIDGGLITPTIIKANEMDLFAIGRTWKELVGKAKAKKLSPAEYNSGTFAISNLGMFGVQQFDAILPPGTGSILAIAASTPKVVQLKNGHFGVQKSMTVTITCDHRHIYGADAAEFLRDLADLLENDVQSLTMG